MEHSYPPPGLVSTPFSVSKVVVSPPTLTATLSVGAVPHSDNVADLFSHFDHGVTVLAQDLSFTVNFSSMERAAQYFEYEVVPQGDHMFRRMEGVSVIDFSFEGGAVPSTLPLVDTESISSYSVDEAGPCSPSGAVMRSRSVTSSGSVVAHPPSGEAITPPPSLLRSNVLKGVSSPPASVEAVPGNPSRESDALPTTSSSIRRTQPNLGRIKARDEQARPESCFVWVFTSDIQAVPLGPCSARKCKKKARFHCSGCESRLLIAYCSKSCQNRVWSTHRTVCFSTKRGGRASPPPTLMKGGTPPCTNGQLSCHEGRVGSKVQCSNCKKSFCSRLCLKSTEHGLGTCGSWRPTPSELQKVLTKRLCPAARSDKRMGLNPYVLLALEAAEDCSDSSGSEDALHSV